MTTAMFNVFLISGALCVVLLIYVVMGAGVVSILTTMAFLGFYMILTLNAEQMIENDYYSVRTDRPACIDSDTPSLGCKKEFGE